MNNYLNELKNEECCGCGACSKICPVAAIEMVTDEEGFRIPRLALERCINCGLCAMVCPMQEEEYDGNKPLQLFSAFSRNTSDLISCSSGAIFPLVADFMFENNGVAIGAAFFENNQLKHCVVNSRQDLQKILGSKYIQSNIEDIFIQCKNYLENKTFVLFVGTPCQVVALKKYLKKDYKTLYTIDLICHGVPSQFMFDEYVKYVEKKHEGKLVDIDFRDKKRNGWSITLRYTMQKGNKKKDYYLISQLSEYFYGFLNGMLLRECCYTCKFSSLKRVGDITLGDFWGYQKCNRPIVVNSQGLSLIFVNNAKGKKICEYLSGKEVSLQEITQNDVLKSDNGNLSHATIRPLCRDRIYHECKNFGFEYISKLYLRKGRTIKYIIKNNIPISVQKMFRKIRTIKWWRRV